MLGDFEAENRFGLQALVLIRALNDELRRRMKEGSDASRVGGLLKDDLSVISVITRKTNKSDVALSPSFRSIIH